MAVIRGEKKEGGGEWVEIKENNGKIKSTQ